MAKEKNAVVAPLLRELVQLGVYKRNQGRIARQVTFAALAIAFSAAVWRLFEVMSSWNLSHSTGDTEGVDRMMRLGICGTLLVAGLWIAYRLVNMAAFADFLIAVEAEMNKVSWPSRTELVRSCIVVIFSIFFLMLVLFGYDIFWSWLLKQIGVMHG